MYSQEELNISNKSYVNKDFPTIYNELLDIAQKISYKYDPTTSNESDPMIVLIKLLALVGDKLNYNVDKNILERFLPSLTQWNSMQERTSSLGYNMHYYQSSFGNISVKFNKNVDSETIDSIDYIEFPAYTTKFTNSSNNINYVLTEPINFYKKDLIKGKLYNNPIIQGELKTFTTLSGDQSLVTITDLDDFNRLYFPEVTVAENGIFIEQSNISEKWVKVDNLNNQLPMTRCYIFRYDSSRKLPYIQFPDDISSLINDGLDLKYIITNGDNGNVNSGSIDKLATNGIIHTINNVDITSDLEDYANLDNYLVSNPSAFTNGTDIENIDEAYNNFQKTVGTFDTLVTCRDYANYIYNLSDEDFNSLVSNIQVCDRRDDYNYSTKVATYNEFGESYLTKIKQVSNRNAISAFDLMLYPLQPLQTIDTNSYKTSFTPLTNTANILKEIENSKCLSHNYKQLDANDIYAVKNYYKLKAKITTTYKVNNLEQISIKNNIIQALVNNFNPRKLDYGTEIPYDTILKVIENADSRIKFVSLDEPELTPKIMTTNNEEYELFEVGSNYKIPYLAKNILAGKVQLFDYNEDFHYDYNNVKSTINNNISTISTCFNEIISNMIYLTLEKNEVIQVFQPSFINGREWQFGWFYKAQGIGTDEDERLIELNANTYIEIYDSENASSPTITLNSGYVKIKGIKNSQDIRQINSGSYILEQTLNQVELNNTSYLYWITNNTKLCVKNNESGKYLVDDDGDILCSNIPWSFNDEYVLLDDEYLYVTDTRYSYLYVYGPGTKLKRPSFTILNEYLPIIEYDKISKEGLDILQNKFIQVPFTFNSKLILTEQSILTLTEGDSIRLDANTSSATHIDLYDTIGDNIYYNPLISLYNSTLAVETKFDYKLSSGEVGKIRGAVAGQTCYMRARYDLKCSSDEYQSINTSKHYIYLDDSTTPLLSTTLLNILSKYPINIVGGNNRFVKYFDLTISDYVENNLLTFDNINLTTPTQTSNILNLADKYNNYYKMSIKSGLINNSDNVKIPISLLDTKPTLIMIYVKPLTPTQMYISLGLQNILVNNLSNNTSNENSDTLTLKEGINILSITKGNATSDSILTIAFNNGAETPSLFNGNIVVSEPRILKNNGDITTSINSQFELNSTEITALMTYINSYKEDFYYNLILNKAYELDESIIDTYSLFNSNNIVNKITIGEIDMDYAINNINIAKSSQL